MLNHEIILGHKVTTVSVDTCVDKIVYWITAKENGRYFVCANPHSLEIAREDSVFQEALHKADIIVPDGVGMIMASKILGGTIRQRITGSDVFFGLSSRLNDISGCSVFFLGSTEETLHHIVKKMKVDFPNIKVAGVFSPPFKAQFSCSENKAILEAINQVKPDVLWVGMTAPKQEKWIYQHRGELNVPFIGAIGAVFDFYTGKVKRSHPVFQNLGLEWLPRLIQEPRRLWRRNLISAPLFLYRVLQAKSRIK